jgi:hypothetical protein
VGLALTTAIVAATGNNPCRLREHIQGAVGSPNVAANVLVSWVPLALATAGLLFTFTGGL